MTLVGGDKPRCNSIGKTRIHRREIQRLKSESSISYSKNHTFNSVYMASISITNCLSVNCNGVYYYKESQ